MMGGLYGEDMHVPVELTQVLSHFQGALDSSPANRREEVGNDEYFFVR